MGRHLLSGERLPSSEPRRRRSLRPPRLISRVVAFALAPPCRDPERIVACTADLVALAATIAVNRSSPWLGVGFALLCFLALAETRESRLKPSVLEAAPVITTRVGVSAVVLTPIAAALDGAGALAWQVLASLGAVLMLREVAYVGVRTGRRRQWLRRPVHLIGSAHDTSRITRLFGDHPELGIDVIRASLDVDDHVATNPSTTTYIVMASGGRREENLVQALRQSITTGVRVYVVPPCAALLPTSRDVEIVRGIPFIRLRVYPRHSIAWYCKRIFDVSVAAVGLVVMSPVLLATAIGVRLSSPGPILFRQTRVGPNGRAITMYKFRTFPVDHIDETFSLEHDECPLAFGRFLRRTSIDELPQLFNVLRGDMSIVGPRPERPYFAEPLAQAVPDYEDRHRVPGGITGAAQVNGLWGNSSLEDRVRLDNRYIDDWSLWRDAVILARTPGAVIRKAGLVRRDQRERVAIIPQAAALEAASLEAAPLGPPVEIDLRDDSRVSAAADGDG